MKNFIPALILLFNATMAMAQTQPYEESASDQSSARRVVEALNLSPAHPPAVEPVAQIAPPAAAVTATGIGPSSNMPQPGDYGYSSWSDLRQLNF